MIQPRLTASTMNDSCHFYGKLNALASFQEAIQTQLHVSLPRDWWVVVADIAGSTLAIERGEYKKVNTVGVACIAAVVNIDRTVQIPYVFGGDGAILAIPGAIIDQARGALRGAQKLSKEDFGLELRIGLVNVGDLVAGGFRVNLAKLTLSEHVTQTCLSGRGWDEAERRTKTPGSVGCVLLSESDSGPAQANFDGFECRWHSVENFNGHKLSLLITATSGNADRNFQIYQDALEKIHSIYGEVQHHHPLRARRMQLTMNPASLSHEARVRSRGENGWKRTRYVLKLLLNNIAGLYLFWRNLDTRTVRWSRYRDDLVENTDFRKFDGTLRMVIDGNDQQFTELASYLEHMFRDKKLAYGMHKSGEALVTCLVHSYSGNHVHFVDGSHGGYAMAARQLKQQIVVLKNTWDSA